MTKMKFDELHVVSDLHFGGTPGFQIFNQGAALAATIRNIASQDTGNTGRKVGFVMNGDIVDFLAEKPPAYLDPEGAIAKLERIFGLDNSGEEAFKDVWCALQEFVAVPDCYLVMVLGNHDVELALPPVTEWLRQSLSCGDAAARGRVLVHFDGAGFACRVGDRKVLCVHGNEVDNWNFIDNRQLLEVARALNRGQRPRDWDANAGTRLVVDIMNDIKQKFPMVDLLKPEVEAALPIVLALNPDAWKQVHKLLVVASHRLGDEIGRRLGFLSTGDALAEVDHDGPDEQRILADFLSAHFQYDRNSLPGADDLLAGGAAAADDETQEFLGPVDFIKGLFGRDEDRRENMRKALLDKLDSDPSFDPDHRDDFYRDLDQEFGSDMDYLIAGHTHFASRLRAREKGSLLFQQWHLDSADPAHRGNAARRW